MEQEEYKGLISPDAYDYLDNTPQEELLQDPILDEQEELSEAYYEIDDDELYMEQPVEDTDDSDMYAYSSLFDEAEEEAYEAQRRGFEEAEEEEPEYSGLADVYPDEEDNPDLPEPLASIVALLPDSCSCSSYLRECDRDQRARIVNALKLAFEAWRKEGKDKMFTIPGTSISIAVVKPSQDPMTQTQRLQSIAAVMVSQDADRWTGLFVAPGDSGRVESASVREISQQDFTQWQWKTVIQLAERIRTVR